MIQAIRAVSLSLLLAISTVTAGDFASEMMDATFKLGRDNSGTCILVRGEAPDPATYLITVAHALADKMAETAVVVLRKRLPDGSYERHEHTVPLRRDGKPLWVRHEKLDLVVLRISDPLPVPVATLPASALADEAQLNAVGVRLCSTLFVLGYPKGLEANAGGLPVARHGIFASPPLLPFEKSPTFLASYPAAPGDSGAPVFVEGTDHHPLVVGIVIEQHYFVDELKGTFQEHVVHNPLGVAIILRAQHIRSTLEKAIEAGAAAPR